MTIIPELQSENFAFSLLPKQDPKNVQAIIDNLGMEENIEGGYFVETDRDPLKIPNPFLNQDPNTTYPSKTSTIVTDATAKDVQKKEADFGQEQDETRNASTSIFYFLTPTSPFGRFHRNKGRTVHTLHKGRARYVVLHPPGAGKEEWKLESFVAGLDLLKGERLQWVVKGGRFKSSFLLEGKDEDGDGEEVGCLISETVVPGFEYRDHDFLREGDLQDLVGAEKAKELEWLVRKK